MMHKFKKDKEYNLYVDNYIHYEWNGWEYNMLFVGCDSAGNNIFRTTRQRDIVIPNNRIIKFNEPVSAIEMFQMYINWKNFYRKGINQDLRFAQTLQSSIVNTLKENKYVVFGSGKLEPFDYRLMYEVRNDIDSGLYQFEVGAKYSLQNGDEIKIVGRVDDMVCGSDGVWRYDCNIDVTNHKSGMVHNSSYEFIDGKNIINKLYGNRYELSKEFQMNSGCMDIDILGLGKCYPLNDIDQRWVDFLKGKGVFAIHPLLRNLI